MKKSVSLRTLFMVLIPVFILGFALSKVSAGDGKEKPSSEAAQNIPFNSKLLNPVLPFVDQSGLDYGELHSFKPGIESIIRKFNQKYPELHVSYYFRDLHNGLSMGVNEDEKFSPASLFKLPLMIAVLKRAEQDPGALKAGFTYHAKDFAGVEEESGFKKEEGKYYTTEDMINQMIEYSDNSASLVLLNYAGDSSVVKVIRDLNFDIASSFDEHTNFVNVKTYAGIFRVLYNGSYLNREMSEKALSLMSQASYKKGIRAAVPTEIPIAQKYGKRDEGQAGKPLKSLQLHHFALVYHPQKPFIIGVMTKGGSLRAKEELIYNLAKYTYDQVDIQCREKKLRGVFLE